MTIRIPAQVHQELPAEETEGMTLLRGDPASWSLWHHVSLTGRSYYYLANRLHIVAVLQDEEFARLVADYVLI